MSTMYDIGVKYGVNIPWIRKSIPVSIKMSIQKLFIQKNQNKLYEVCNLEYHCKYHLNIITCKNEY